MHFDMSAQKRAYSRVCFDSKMPAASDRSLVVNPKDCWCAEESYFIDLVIEYISKCDDAQFEMVVFPVDGIVHFHKKIMRGADFNNSP